MGLFHNYVWDLSDSFHIFSSVQFNIFHMIKLRNQAIQEAIFVMILTTGYMLTVMMLRIRNIVNFKTKMMIFHGCL